MMDRQSEPERSSGSRPAILAALALVLAVLAIGLTVVLYYSSGPTERRIAASGMQQAPATAPAPSHPTAPPPVAEAPTQPATAPAAPQASPPRAVDDERAEGQEQESSGTVCAPKPMPPIPLPAEPSPRRKLRPWSPRLSNRSAAAPAGVRGRRNRQRTFPSSLAARRRSSSPYRRKARSTSMASTTARHRRSRRSISSRECIASRFVAGRGSRISPT